MNLVMNLVSQILRDSCIRSTMVAKLQGTWGHADVGCGLHKLLLVGLRIRAYGFGFKLVYCLLLRDYCKRPEDQGIVVCS